jgi:hypothetical protein
MNTTKASGINRNTVLAALTLFLVFAFASYKYSELLGLLKEKEIQLENGREQLLESENTKTKEFMQCQSDKVALQSKNAELQKSIDVSKQDCQKQISALKSNSTA